MSLPSPELPEKLRQGNQLGDLPVFYLQGGWAPDRVNPMTRAMVNLVTRSTRRELQAKGADRTPQEEAMLGYVAPRGQLRLPGQPAVPSELAVQTVIFP